MDWQTAVLIAVVAGVVGGLASRLPGAFYRYWEPLFAIFDEHPFFVVIIFTTVLIGWALLAWAAVRGFVWVLEFFGVI